MPELSSEQETLLERIVTGVWPPGTETQEYAACLLEEAVRDKSGDAPSVRVEDAEGNRRWLPAEETSLDWNDDVTGKLLMRVASEHRPVWDGLRARLKEQFKRGEDPPRWLLIWAAEVYTEFWRPNSGKGKGRPGPPRKTARNARFAIVADLLCAHGYGSGQAEQWIAARFPELDSCGDAVRKAIEAGRS